MTSQHTLDPAQAVILLEACRSKDRLDWLFEGASRELPGGWRLTVDEPGDMSNQTANLLKMLLAALRLPDKHGRRPQRRGGARGVYRPQAPQQQRRRA